MKRTLFAAAALFLGTTSATVPVVHAQTVDLTGAGSTFAQPIYTKWAAAYDQTKHVKINYTGGGSGAGKHQLQELTVDFGGTDGPMTDAEITAAKGGMVLHIPMVIGAVGIAYNLPSLKAPLKLDGPVIADIYLGKITKWNDSRIAAMNAGVALPKSDIAVVHRADGSGTTFIFTDYLSAVSPEWMKAPGKGTDVQWPTGLGAQGNAGVGGQVKQIEGAIGYVELAFINQNKLQAALIKNKDGRWVGPSAKGATAAAAGATAALPGDFRGSIVNASGPDAYPISSFTWMMLYKKQTDGAKGHKLVDFIKWSLENGDQMAESLDYAPLPATLKAKVMARLNDVEFGK